MKLEKMKEILNTNPLSVAAKKLGITPQLALYYKKKINRQKTPEEIQKEKEIEEKKRKFKEDFSKAFYKNKYKDLQAMFGLSKHAICYYRRKFKLKKNRRILWS